MVKEKLSKQQKEIVKKEVDKVAKKCESQVKKVEEKAEKEIEKKVEQEVKKRLRDRIYNGVKRSASKFKKEFKKQLVVGITAAFAFLLALSWREPIKDSVDSLIVKFGLVGQEIYFKYVSALVITLIAVIIFLVVSWWRGEGD